MVIKKELPSFKVEYLIYLSQSSVAGTVPRPQADDRGIVVKLPAVLRDFSLL
jgi:hypothetical protein